ncbi:HPr family phosphocarrier protein [Actinophytocola sp.]|uniref:HPr family phosphocarrier protein n=1 Tax=Actinophytocola sp. TaxID=1872138 RepID=UPI003D6AFE7E
MSRVGLVVVSHSAKLAEGVVEVAAQMAPDVTVVAAGGTAEGGIGTDFDAVDAAIERADGGAGVVLLYDLGSARMVAELALESRAVPDSAVPDSAVPDSAVPDSAVPDSAVPDGAVLVDAPLVEGTVAAAVAAQSGSPLAEVAAAARAAAARPTEPTAAGPAGVPDVEPGGGPTETEVAAVEETRIRLTNEIGLHARPAALLARSLSEVDAEVTVRFGASSAPGRSVLALMALGARKGDELTLSATGPQAAEALRKAEALATRNFDEP